MARVGKRLHLLLRQVPISYFCNKIARASSPISPFLSSLIHVNRDTGVIAIESLMERRGTFDYILLETTGLADPGNIAPLFWVDDGLGSSIYLDGIVTLVDAKNILRLLDEPAALEVQETFPGRTLTTAHLQISHADVVILNKRDLVSIAELEKVKERITSINGLARVHVTDHTQIPQIEGTVLELHAYDNMANVDLNEKGHSRLDPVGINVYYAEQSVEGGRSGKKTFTLFCSLTVLAHVGNIHHLLHNPSHRRRKDITTGCMAAFSIMGSSPTIVRLSSRA